MSEDRGKNSFSEIAKDIWVWLQSDGSSGRSNGGLVCGQGESLLVDTLFDLASTREMLSAMRTVTEGRPIKTLVNTHANGDHCWGNELLPDSEIISTRRCKEEMLQLLPQTVAGLLKAKGLGEAGDYLRYLYSQYRFDDITLRAPTRVFDKELALRIGNREIHLIEVGPAHTAGDMLVYIPDAKVVFAGDIVYNKITPMIWSGPVANWIAACDRILNMDVQIVVPGHGPVTDKKGVENVKRYLADIYAETKQRFSAAMPFEKARRDICQNEKKYSDWKPKETTAANIYTIYRELANDTSPPNVLEILGIMAREWLASK